MTEITNQTLSGPVILDGNTYVDVTFADATLLFTGGMPPSFTNCSFQTVTFKLEGSAANTAGFLNMMALPSSNMRNIALGLLPNFGDA